VDCGDGCWFSFGSDYGIIALCSTRYQSTADAERLRSLGRPWPSNDIRLRAALGPGVYAWKHPTEAIGYRRTLKASDLVILRFYVDDCFLAGFRQLDLARFADDDATAWLRQFAPMYDADARPHGLEYIQRGTNVREHPEPIAVEHYFHSSVFSYLWFC
jgi:hypothetical protein